MKELDHNLLPQAANQALEKLDQISMEDFQEPKRTLDEANQIVPYVQRFVDDYLNRLTQFKDHTTSWHQTQLSALNASKNSIIKSAGSDIPWQEIRKTA